MQTKYLPENTNPQNSDWLLTENDTAAQKVSVENLLSLAVTPTDLQIADVSGLQAALNNKADDSDISALSSAVAAKANQTAVDTLITAISGKIDKTLTEISTVSANDFLILETTTGTNKKIKTGLIKTSSVITSQVEPSNPPEGLFWNEADNNGHILESWVRNSYRWVSGLKQYSGGSGSTAGNFQEYLALDITRDIIVSSFYLHLHNTGSASYSGVAYLTRELGISITIANLNTNAIAPNARASYKVALDSLNNLYDRVTAIEKYINKLDDEIKLITSKITEIGGLLGEMLDSADGILKKVFGSITYFLKLFNFFK